MDSGITLITATGNRPEAFQLCELYMMRQTYRGPLQWLCCDDCEPRTDFTCDNQEIIYPPWIWKPGDNTQAKNLLFMIDKIRYDKILFIEDDEWYSPEYVEQMALKLDRYQITGEGKSRYYNVQFKTWIINSDIQHAALARTGIRSSLIPDLKKIIEKNKTLIDVKLWQTVKNSQQGIFFDQQLSVGIKGMPGRPGIGNGHRRLPGAHFDADGRTLREWIGNDYEFYLPYMGKLHQ